MNTTSKEKNLHDADYVINYDILGRQFSLFSSKALKSEW